MRQTSSLFQALNFTYFTCGFSCNANDLVSVILLVYALYFKAWSNFIVAFAIYDGSFAVILLYPYSTCSPAYIMLELHSLLFL